MNSKVDNLGQKLSLTQNNWKQGPGDLRLERNT